MGNNKSGILLITLMSCLLNKGYGAHYQFPETNPCELVDIDASFSLRYDDGSGNSEDAPEFTLSNATIRNESSSCVDPDLEHLLDFDLHPSGERLSLSFQKNGSQVNLMVFFLMDPTKHFTDLNGSAVVMADSTHLQVGDTDHSYKCHAEQVITFSNQSNFYMNITIRNVQLQAYSVNGSEYSSAVECSLDHVTTEGPVSEMTSVFPDTSTSEHMTSEYTNPQTTMTSSPTSSPTFRLHFEVKNGSITCILLDGSFTLSIPYVKKDNTESEAVINIPNTAKSIGSGCTREDRELLQITFFLETSKPWLLDINLVKMSPSYSVGMYTADSEVAYSWENVGLVYYIDSHFKDAKEISGDVISILSSNLTGSFEATNTGSYKCDKAENITVENVTLTVTNLQYRAFGTTKSDTYPKDNVHNCENPDKPSKKKNSTGKTIGIIVGSVCCALIVLAVVIFLFVRYKRRSSYKELSSI